MLLIIATLLMTSGCGKSDFEKENPLTTVKALQEQNDLLKKESAKLDKRIQELERGGPEAERSIRDEMKKKYESQIAEMRQLSEENVTKLRADKGDLLTENIKLKETIGNFQELAATSARLPDAVKSNFTIERLVWLTLCGMSLCGVVVLASLYHWQHARMARSLVEKAATVQAIQVCK